MFFLRGSVLFYRVSCLFSFCCSLCHTRLLTILVSLAADAVTSVAFSPDGESIVTGSNDGKVKVWNFHINTSISLVCDYLQPFIEGLNNPSLLENSRQMRIRARRACEGIPPPKISTIPSQTKETQNPITWATQLVSQTLQSIIRKL